MLVSDVSTQMHCPWSLLLNYSCLPQVLHVLLNSIVQCPVTEAPLIGLRLLMPAPRAAHLAAAVPSHSHHPPPIGRLYLSTCSGIVSLTGQKPGSAVLWRVCKALRTLHTRQAFWCSHSPASNAGSSRHSLREGWQAPSALPRAAAGVGGLWRLPGPRQAMAALYLLQRMRRS